MRYAKREHSAILPILKSDATATAFTRIDAQAHSEAIQLNWFLLAKLPRIRSDWLSAHSHDQ
jgi:hypothetical protein